MRRDLEQTLIRLYAVARKQAAVDLEYGEREAADALPAECAYTIEQVLAEDRCPEPAAKNFKTPSDQG